MNIRHIQDSFVFVKHAIYVIGIRRINPYICKPVTGVICVIEPMYGLDVLNNHHIEEYGPLRWKHVSGGTEIYWIPVILIRNFCEFE